MDAIENLETFLRELMDGEPLPFPSPRHQYALRVAPDVFRAMQDAADANPFDVPQLPLYGQAPVTVIDDMAPGRYELLRDGKLRKTGSISEP